MRDDSLFDSDDQAAYSAAPPWRGKMATAAGAVISLAILITVVVWSYRLGVRDADDVPIIRAEATTTKIRPEEPGGLEVANQDRAVYGVVSGKTVEEEVALAPPPPALAPEDRAPIARSPKPGARPVNPATVKPEPVAPPPGSSTDAGAAVPPAGGGAPAEGDEIEAAVAAALADAGVETRPAADTEAVNEAVEEGAGPAASPAPPRRPARRAERPAAPSAPEAIAVAAAQSEEAQAAASASKIQVQLGAFESEAIAAAQWSEIRARNNDLLTGKARVIMPVTSGGRQLFRLRAGPFDTIEQASTMCRGLIARNQDCIVARAQ